jgi:tetratricopeptide (TPR) repeat protein
VQRQLGDLAGAENTLQKGLRVDPTNHVATAQLGQIYQDRGQTDLAAAMYQRSLHKNWYQPGVQSRLATLRTTQPTSTVATQTAFYPPPGPAAAPPIALGPNRAPQAYPLPTYRRSQPAMALSPPNADPAHVPATADAGVVAPF